MPHLMLRGPQGLIFDHCEPRLPGGSGDHVAGTRYSSWRPPSGMCSHASSAVATATLREIGTPHDEEHYGDERARGEADRPSFHLRRRKSTRLNSSHLVI